MSTNQLPLPCAEKQLALHTLSKMKAPGRDQIPIEIYQDSPVCQTIMWLLLREVLHSRTLLWLARVGALCRAARTLLIMGRVAQVDLVVHDMMFGEDAGGIQFRTLSKRVWSDVPTDAGVGKGADRVGKGTDKWDKPTSSSIGSTTLDSTCRNSLYVVLRVGEKVRQGSYCEICTVKFSLRVNT
eukprot:COSAG01_NODE_13239_length_1614_cov_2.088449_1_plen_184_part_00